MKNAYCERLGIAVPRVEDVLDRMRKPNLFHLLIAVLLERGGPMTLDQLKHAQATGEPVDVVLDRAPGWEEPWARAQRAWVEDVGPWEVVLRIGEELWHRDRRDIHAIRPVRSVEPSVH